MAFALESESANPAGSNSGSSTTIAAPAIAVATGELVVVSVRWEGGGANDAATITVADTIGNTYTVGPTRDNDSGGEGKKIVTAYCLESVGTEANNIVTATISSARTYRGIVASSFSSEGSVMFVDSDEGFSDTNTGTFTTGTVDAETGDLLYGAMGTWETIPAENATLDSGWNSIPASPPADRLQNAGYQVAASATTYVFSGTLSSTDSYVALILQFREGGGGGSVAHIPAYLQMLRSNQ